MKVIGWSLEKEDLKSTYDNFDERDIDFIIDDNVRDYLEAEVLPTREQEAQWIKQAFHRACADVEDETKQAMEAMIHNFNTLHSRAGKMCA